MITITKIDKCLVIELTLISTHYALTFTKEFTKNLYTNYINIPHLVITDVN